MKNLTMHNKDVDKLKVIEEDYRSMGWSTRLEGNSLTVFSVAPQPVKVKAEKKRTGDDEEAKTKDKSQKSKRDRYEL